MAVHVRRIRVFNRITPDGAFTGADGDYQSIYVDDPELDAYVVKGSPAADIYLMGRKTYDMMASFWPTVAQDPSLPPAARKMAKALDDGEKVVISSSLKKGTWKNTRILSTFDPEAIESLKAEKGGGDILVLGSGSIVSQLTQHELVDDYTLILAPRLSGDGRPLFSGVTAPTDLRLVEAKAFPSGNVLLRYTRK